MTNRTPKNSNNEPFDRPKHGRRIVDDLTRDRSSFSSERRDPSSLRIADGPAMAKPRADRYKLKKSIKKHCFVSPLIIRPDGRIFDGRSRREIAIALGMPAVPVLVVSQLCETDRAALARALQALANLVDWER